MDFCRPSKKNNEQIRRRVNKQANAIPTIAPFESFSFGELAALGADVELKADDEFCGSTSPVGMPASDGND